MDQAEKTFLIAAVGYSRSSNTSLTKISWAMASILQQPENNVYYKLKKIDDDFDKELKAIYGIRELASDAEEEYEEIADDNLESRLGDIVNAQVLSIKTFGAVCKVENTSRTLLLHLSEIANDFVDDVRNYLKEGDRLKAMIIVNPEGKLGLSRRRVLLSSAEHEYKNFYSPKRTN